MNHNHPRTRQDSRHTGFPIGILGALVFALLPMAADAGARTPTFAHIGTFDVTTNAGSEVAEIVAASIDGRTLIYTDSDAELIGLVDISNPSNPQPDGVVPVGGEPTSVAVKGKYAVAGVNTSTTAEVTCDGEEIEFITEWNGELAVIDLRTRAVVRTIPLGGQPDSIAVSPNGRYAAVVIENERNEDVGGGLIPQGRGTDRSDPCDLRPTGDPNPGALLIVDLKGTPRRWTTRTTDLTGIPGMAAAEDPEPEYVDINRRNQAVVTLQENNQVAVVDLRTGTITDSFPAGAVELRDLDATEEELGPQENGLIIFEDSLLDPPKRREPDAVTWISKHLFATANEGDYEDADGEEGGSRGFTIFNRKGDILFDVGEDFEYASASAGHYNEGRSENKGGEPEAIEYGRYRGRDLLFVAAERANVLGVYDVDDPADPELLQLLPTGIGPEGLLAIPNRRLFVVANEVSEGGVPSMITIYKTGHRTANAYPQLSSMDGAAGTPIPWVAMSGLAGDPDDPDTVYGVSDSFLATGYIYAIDVSGDGGVITNRIEVTDPWGETQGWPEGFFPDLEGIAVAPEDGLSPEGGFWLASEGRNGARPNAIILTNRDGEIMKSVELPAELVSGATNSGFEGVAVSADGSHVYAVVQRDWNAGDGGVLADPENRVKIARWDGKKWTFVHYERAEPKDGQGWVGLSEISLLPDGTFAIIERDNQLGTAAVIKKVYGVDLATAAFTADLKNPLPEVQKDLLADLLHELEANSVWTPDKLEGLAVTADGRVHMVTDNDGLDDAIGQTLFLNLGNWEAAFSRD